MSSENYFNHYVATLTNTMTDAIIRNVSLQAQLKVNEETIKELNEAVEYMDAEIGELKKSENTKLTNLENEVKRLNDELNSVRDLKQEYENTRNQVGHLNTFKNEVLKCREENKKLLEQIEYLNLPPAKRKKLDQLKSKEEPDLQENGSVKDGGTF